MRQPLQLLGLVCVALFMLVEAGPLNAWLRYGVGVPGVHPAVLPGILGVILFAVLRELKVFRDLWGVVSLVVAVPVTMAWSGPFNLWIYQNIGRWFYSWIGPTGLFLVVLGLVQHFGRMVMPPMQLQGFGLATFPGRRRLVAVAINACMTAGVIVAGLAFGDWYTATFPMKDGMVDPAHNLAGLWAVLYQIIWVSGPGIYPTVAYVMLAVIFACVWAVCLDPVQRVIAVAARPFMRLGAARLSGLGGSARFFGYVDEWRMRWQPGMIPLGRSTYDGKTLGRKDDRHAIIVAASRSGKFRSFLSRIAMSWRGSLFCIDPKGELAAVTARMRKKWLGQTVHILDPFNVLRDTLKMPSHWWEAMGQGGQPYRTARYNPLADIDPSAADALSQIKYLILALVVSAGNDQAFWDKSSTKVLLGVIAHVLVSDDVADQDRHLGTVRDYVYGLNGRSLATLNRPVPAGRPRLGDVALAAYNLLAEAGDRSGPDILLTLRIHLEWLDEDLIRDHLSASDFSLNDLKHRRESVYLVLPQNQLAVHGVYLRLVVTMAMRSASKGHKARDSLLFLMDEFPALHRLDVCAQAASASTGNGVMLCPVVQSLSQLQIIYGQGWNVFVNNAGPQIVFGTNDADTASAYAHLLGNHMTWRYDGRAEEWVPYGVSNLRTEGEIMREGSRDSGQAFVFFPGAEAMLVGRANYDTWFGAYDPNPYEPYGFKVRVRAGVAWLLRQLAPRKLWRTWLAIHDRLTTRNAY